ncbi:HNH endonuclease [Serratia plymuthica]|uniref:HNH endonuclease n=1 Tax=Serratia plymuthica TaxID=82996 RepID=UPI0019295E2E|nr:HNH endonuclease [Serratia plymuthica]MBL3524167.1 HNH endonuclease [Serratia plymuthica]
MVTYIELLSRLDYTPTTGVFIWKIPPNFHPELKGKTAGTKTPDGYIKIRINGKKYFAHRLAWLFHFGDFPEMEIDHKNRIRHDNRINNLRLASNPQNQANRRRKTGKIFTKGVRILPSGKFNARISFNKKLINLGTFDTEKIAGAAYLQAARKFYGKYARGS